MIFFLIHRTTNKYLLAGGDVFDGESWWEGLLEFLGLVSVLNFQGVKVSRASDLEFGLTGLVDLDGNGLGVLSSGLQEEILDLTDLLRHFLLSTNFRVFCKFDLRL